MARGSEWSFLEGLWPPQRSSCHIRGHWGEVDADDKRANDNAVLDMTRILSAYRTAKGVKLWIIAEADRSSTCILLPDEY